MHTTPVPHRSPDLIQIVDAALADAVLRSGPHLACRPGCSQCCHGVFAISPLDAHRLQHGLTQLETSDPARAHRIRTRTAQALARLTPGFPGDPDTGHLGTSPVDEEAFEDFANDEPCPALDPATQTCDLYASRPILCRTFGPPLRTPEAGLAICDLCFTQASPEEIQHCQLDPALPDLEAAADEEHAARAGEDFRTIIAFALARIPSAT